ncbi:drug/metabolite transporter (DMT)-like permease [Krasilnikovia cinnamomea]|uniref:Drug/metabolite transporter (DMT)-like permease n=1 Tax=Krasilnikovia cinnamomea TaxID=349313 RepID=A0A4Q7ZIT0_9ACTN|nr:DMT family transporter [Krasilnikovia cinnamomea]RZU50371.1 drug/metabolite transporter (DMT)-like permease [Krasilnikovia cinnamomea]
MSAPRHPSTLPTVAALAVAVLAVSSSAPLIKFAAAPALAVAFWRNGLAALALTPVACGPRRGELRDVLRGVRRRDGMFCLLAGVALAAHFATWMPSVQLGSVATATALVATQPVWQGLIAAAQGRRPTVAGWCGIALAVAGAAWATGVDVGVSGRAVAADVLALLGGMFAAVYTALGERARSRLSTTTYTWICYGTCAVLLLAICLAVRLPLTGYNPRTWAAILALVVGAQLLGHSMFNYALHRTSATTVSVLILLEVPGAAALAWVWLGQAPDAAALPGIALLLAGVAVVVLGGGLRRDARDATASLADAADPAPR